MKRFFLLALLSIFFVGCSSTAPTKDTTVYQIDSNPIGQSENLNKSRVVIERKGNLTRIYTIKGD